MSLTNKEFEKMRLINYPTSITTGIFEFDNDCFKCDQTWMLLLSFNKEEYESRCPECGNIQTEGFE